MKLRIVYIEIKPQGGRGSGAGRIERVRFSKSGNVLYCRAFVLEKIRETDGIKANYVNIQTDEKYWVSGCKKRGDDRLQPGTIEIDDNAREEYWLQIRNMPECVEQTAIRSSGKYGRASRKGSSIPRR